MIAAAIAASSTLPMVLVIPAPFGSLKLELPELGCKTPAQILVSPSWIWQLSSVSFQDFQSELLSVSPGLD